MSALGRRFKALLEKMKGEALLSVALWPLFEHRFDEVFIGHKVNLYVLAGAIVAGLLFIGIMGYIVYEMFKH